MERDRHCLSLDSKYVNIFYCHRRYFAEIDKSRLKLVDFAFILADCSTCRPRRHTERKGSGLVN